MKTSYHGAENKAAYQQAVKAAVAEVAFNRSDLTGRAAGREVSSILAAQGITLSDRSCNDKVKAARETNVVVTPQPPGGTYVSTSIERRIAEAVAQLRDKEYPVFPEDIKAWCKKEVEGTVWHKNFLDENGNERAGAYDGWYKGFLNRQEFVTGTMRPLEISRKEWFTAENLATYYRVAKPQLVKAGVAEPNPNYDPNARYSEEIIITRPERICSYDETKLELDCTQGGKGKKDRLVRAGPEDNGQCVVTKSSKCASVACGRLGDGRALPPYIVFASGEEFDPCWTIDEAEEDILDKDGKPLQWRYASNPKGSVNEAFCVDYLENVIHPALGYPKPRDKHPGQQGVVVCDGVGTHCGLTVVEKALELGLEILLRVPNLSWVLQGEDTVNFAKLKARWRREKHEMFRRLNEHRRTDKASYVALGYEHMMRMFRVAFREAFPRASNLEGWALEGIIPFTKHQLWRKIEADESAAAKSSQVSTRASHVSLGPASRGPGASNSPTDDAQQSAPVAPASMHHRLAELTDDLKGHLTYAEQVQPPSGQIDQEELLQQNLMMRQALLAMGGFIKDNHVAPQQQQQQQPGNVRVTARNIYDKAGSLTGPEAMQMLREKEEKKKAEEAQKAANRESRERKQTLQLSKSISKGSELLTALATGERVLGGLNKPELKALLLNANPSASIPDSELKESLKAKAEALETVQESLRRRREALAAARHAAATAAAAAPLLPPQPQNPAENVNRLSVGSNETVSPAQAAGIVVAGA